MSGRYERTFSWTDEAVDDLRRMWCKERASASMISAALSHRFGAPISRNAVIGKANRLKLVQASKFMPPKKTPKQSAPVVKKTDPVVKKPSAVVVAPTVEKKLKVAQIPNHAKTVSLMDLKQGMCRRPIGDPREESFRFCGHQVRNESSVYCQHHSSIAYAPQQRREPRKSADPRGMLRIQINAF